MFGIFHNKKQEHKNGTSYPSQSFIAGPSSPPPAPPMLSSPTPRRGPTLPTWCHSVSWGLQAFAWGQGKESQESPEPVAQ